MTSKATNKFSVEVRARAVRMVQEHDGGVSFALGGRGVGGRQDRLLGAHPQRVAQEG